MKVYVVFSITSILVVCIVASTIPARRDEPTTTTITTTTTRGWHRCALARRATWNHRPFLRIKGNMPHKKHRKRPNPFGEMPNMNVGPKRNGTYNPTWGYEPYWEGGDWVFDTAEDNDSDNVCGTKCSPIYLEYGPICGRNKKFQHKSFENYCEMRKDNNCKGGWKMAYRGECTTIRTLPTHEFQIVTRVPFWLAQFSKRYGM